VAKDKLAKLLDDKLEEALEPLDVPLTDAAKVGNVWNSPESLWHTLLALAAERIHYDVAAEAVLIWAGKWAPDKYPPEVL
jgi:hypothetical protein